ncbi:MAG: EamA family transporter [Hymenobacteraceae bacterium]|nr:EamA family transporter [Hymenobacteraceae bacterium]MDX5482911.1 EamA family transporter [Hymenobacteraceae bacterium]
MLYLILSVLSGASLIFIFKLYERFNVHTFQAIVINYITCILVGLAFPGGTDVLQPQVLQKPWAIYALILGAIFIGAFYLIAMTTQKVGVTAASVAAKISLVIPVLFSLLVLKSSLKDYTFVNYLGMGLALIAIVLSSLRPGEDGEKNTPRLLTLVLPFVIFLCSGFADSLINYVNEYHLQAHEASQFTMLTFTASAVIGMAVLGYMLLMRKTVFRARSIWAGIVLGIPNYFSIFFLIMALSAFGNDGAFLYPVNNIGIIMTGALGAVLVFREKLSTLNLVGLGIAVLALVLLSYQEIAANLF